MYLYSGVRAAGIAWQGAAFEGEKSFEEMVSKCGGGCRRAFVIAVGNDLTGWCEAKDVRNKITQFWATCMKKQIYEVCIVLGAEAAVWQYEGKYAEAYEIMQRGALSVCVDDTLDI